MIRSIRNFKFRQGRDCEKQPLRVLEEAFKSLDGKELKKKKGSETKRALDKFVGGEL